MNSKAFTVSTMAASVLLLVSCASSHLERTASGYLEIKGESGLIVSLGNDFQGITNETDNGLVLGSIAPGSYELRIVKDGYKPQTAHLTVLPGSVVIHEIQPFTAESTTLETTRSTLLPSASSSESPRPGESHTVDLGNGVTMPFRWIPPGNFVMGSPFNEEGRDSDEGPQTAVTFTNGFWMGETEVTQAQWKAVMGANNNPSYLLGDTLPVEQVSWDEIMGESESGNPISDPNAFMGRLSSLVGATFLLPSEAEWEYACRAGTTTPFHFGHTITTDQANYDGNYIYGDGRRGVNRKASIPVGSFSPNAWGLMDMHGNVWEWTSSWYGPYPGGNKVDYTGPTTGGARVFRGGSWYYLPDWCRSAYRDSIYPWFRIGHLGFRVMSADLKPAGPFSRNPAALAGDEHAYSSGTNPID
jgi:formylglycine-generating enzyme required for sulfatase activity